MIALGAEYFYTFANIWRVSEGSQVVLGAENRINKQSSNSRLV